MLLAPTLADDAARIESLRGMGLHWTKNEECFDRITRTAKRIFDTPIALLTLVDEEHQWFKSCMGLQIRQTPRDISFCGHAILGDQPFVVEDARADPRFADNPLVTGEPGIRFYAGRPVRNHENRVVGTLCIIDRRPRKMGAEERQMLDELGYWVETVFKWKASNKCYMNLLVELGVANQRSLVDPLLDIWNRRGILEVLDTEINHALREQTALSIMMIDVDCFKSINDTHGHQAGDLVLQEIVHLIRRSFRPYDAIGRYGGEEFLVILPGTDVEAGIALAERARAQVEDGWLLAGRDNLCCTVSIGVTSVDFDQRQMSRDALIAEADRALLEAKRSGRNRVVRFA